MKQLSIITKNRLGVITKISETLAAENINIESLNAEIAGERVVVVLNTDQYEKAFQVIQKLDDMRIVTEDANIG